MVNRDTSRPAPEALAAPRLCFAGPPVALRSVPATCATTCAVGRGQKSQHFVVPLPV